MPRDNLAGLSSRCSAAEAAMQKFERSLENAPNMHLSGAQRRALNVIGQTEQVT